MKRLKLCIVTRKLWPVSGPAELAVIDLAEELARQGHDVSIVTAKWRKSWPSVFAIRGVPVTRLIRPTSGPWGSFRFQRQLSRFLTQQGPLDGIIAFGGGDESLTAVRTCPGCPVVTRVDYRQSSYHQWPNLLSRRAVSGLNASTAIAVDSALTEKQIGQYEVDKQKVIVVRDGVKGPEPDHQRSHAKKITARSSISDAHPILSIEPTRPFVICTAPLDNDGGVIDLVKAWKEVIQWNPKAKLWLIGDGSHGRQVWDNINRLNLVYSVIMPGYFDDLTEVFLAADLFIHPLRSGRACSGLLRAMAHGLCAVATETPFTRSLVKRDETGISTPIGHPSALAEAIMFGLNSNDLRARLGNNARKHIAESHGIEQKAKTYINLINEQHPAVTPQL